MKHQKESLEKLCIWKGVIERDVVMYGVGGRAQETIKCDLCDGYDETCLAYLPKEMHDRRRILKPKDI